MALSAKETMPVHNLPTTSLAVADDLRRAERSINTATRDIAQFLLSTLEAADAHGLSGAMSHGTVKATVASLAARGGQSGAACDARPSVDRACGAQPWPGRIELGRECAKAVACDGLG